MKLLGDANGNAKLAKTIRNAADAPLLVHLSLAPASVSGINVCAGSTAGCRSVCVGEACGMVSVFNSIREARIRKTRFLLRPNGRPTTRGLDRLIEELDEAQRRADRSGRILYCRLNTFSDLPWERPAFGRIPQQFPRTRFFDYTKRHRRVPRTPENYWLCGSWSERASHQVECVKLLRSGFNVAAAFYQEGRFAGRAAINQKLPTRKTIDGTAFNVFDGDHSDLIPDDPGPDRRGYGRFRGLVLKASTLETREDGIDSGFAIRVR